MHLHLLPFLLLIFFITPPHLCYAYRSDCLSCYTGTIIYQCLGLVVWSTEVLTEGLPLLFGIQFSTVIFLALLFSLC